MYCYRRIQFESFECFESGSSEGVYSLFTKKPGSNSTCMWNYHLVYKKLVVDVTAMRVWSTDQKKKVTCVLRCLHLHEKNA